jgi:hypothetical protein
MPLALAMPYGQRQRLILTRPPKSQLRKKAMILGFKTGSRTKDFLASRMSVSRSAEEIYEAHSEPDNTIARRRIMLLGRRRSAHVVPGW